MRLSQSTQEENGGRLHEVTFRYILINHHAKAITTSQIFEQLTNKLDEILK